MSTLFTINFRREAYRKQVARARARVLNLGAWFTYFGVMAIVIGLYVLNLGAFARRVDQLERQTERNRARGVTAEPPALAAADARQLERYVLNLSGQRDRLRRLGEILPPTVRVTQIRLNPENISGVGPHKLVIVGLMRTQDPEDRLRGVMGLVTMLQGDSVFRRGMTNVKLASTTTTEGAGTEFVIECR